jgi:uncharacterized protein
MPHADSTTAILLLGAASIGGLLLIPFGLPGLWLIVLGILGYGWLTDFRTLSGVLVGVILLLALAGELLESWISYRFARRYGGSKRAGWGALIGGLVGVAVGVPVPVVGSIVAGFIGAFVGAALFEYTAQRESGAAAKAGWGAVLGRAVAAGTKMAIGVVLVVIGAVVVLRG